ncbi:MAG: winged helix DNA-binding domain-containing protein [Acidobacteria bacterium]|nr:winged helix DNA-binding domain-containing protein [Acidobacteriota bacterium]
MDQSRLRAWWWHRQGLDGSLEGNSPAEVLERCGWARSVAGVGPYLTLFSRAGIRREAVDAAVAALEIHELPSARGCTYVLPAADFALGLLASVPFAVADFKVALKLGVTEKEIGKLCEAILKALSGGPLEPDAIREATGSASRSLGEAGKKKGVGTTLPIALSKLQRSGDIRRISTNGRLDQQRYRYALWKPNPCAKSRLSEEDVAVELARRFFRWIGPATAGELQGFTALGVKVNRAAMDRLGVVPVEKGGDRFMLPDDLDAFKRFKAPKAGQIALVSSIDALVLMRRDVRGLLDEKDAGRKVVGDKQLVQIGGLMDLPSHAIFDRGRLIGLWEFDPDAGTIAWSGWEKGKAIEAAVARTESFVRDQLGDARSFSLDSPKSRAPRIAALRKG